MRRLILGAILGLLVGAQEVHACACCTNTGQRYAGVETLDTAMREQLGGLRFSADAELFVGEGDPEYVEGIVAGSSHYEMHVAQEERRWVFDFRDKAGHTGTLVLPLPATLGVLSVDPRSDTREGGTGPSLYKEWTLNAKAAGTGIFAAGLRGGARITLVLQGHGNNCTSIGDASHWMLEVRGPKARYHLFGELVR